MTVPAGLRSKTYAIAPGATAYPVPFVVITASDLGVYVTATAAFDIGSPGMQLTEGVHYTISGDATIAAANIVPTGAFPTSGFVTAYRVTSMAQSAAYTPNDGFPAESHEEQLDRLSLVDQETAADLGALGDRAIQVPVGEAALPVEPLATRGGKVAIWDALGRLASLGYQSLASALAPFLPAVLGPFYKGDPGGNVMAIGLFAAASTLFIPGGTDLVQTAGWAASGTGAAKYQASALVDAAYVAANPRSSFISANGRGFRLAELAPTPQMFGAAGDNATNDYPALQPWLDYGGSLRLERVTHFCVGQLEVRCFVSIVGAGTGFDARKAAQGNVPAYAFMPGSRIRFPVNFYGMRVEAQTTDHAIPGTYPPVFTQEGGYGSFFQGFELLGGGGTAPAHGFEALTRVYVDRVVCNGFSGIGFNLQGSANIPDLNSPYGNTSGSMMSGCVALNNIGGGFRVGGLDASVMTGVGCYAIGNGGWDFKDDTNFGTTWIGPHSAKGSLSWQGSTNGVPNGGSFYANSAIGSTRFENVYTEGDVPMYVGSQHRVSGILPTNLHPQPGLMVAGPFTSGIGDQRLIGPAGSQLIRSIGPTTGAANDPILDSWGAQPLDIYGGGSRDIVQRYSAASGYAYGSQQVQSWNGARGQFLAFPHDRATEFRFFAPVFDQGIVIGSPANSVYLGVTNADGSIPDGVFGVGDELVIKNAVPGGKARQKCTTAGVKASTAWAAGAMFYATPTAPYAAYYRTNGGNVYQLVSIANPGAPAATANAPTHTAGTVVGADGYGWKFLNATSVPVFKAAGAIDA